MANQWNRTVWGTALLFGLLGLALQWWRMSSLTSSMDQGILFQILWNGLHGHPFESTLSSQLSTNVVHAGELPRLGYHRLGCLLYTSPSPRDATLSRMPSSA